MFERYTEPARRAIFFARFEASRFGHGFIEPEHLLLALLREATGLAYQLLRAAPAGTESLRRDIEANTKPVEKVSTSVDLPLSHPCVRVLAYAGEESERLASKHIDTVHLLLGILREETSFAAQLLRKRHFTLEVVRDKARQSEAPPPSEAPPVPARVEKWLAQRVTPAANWTIDRQQTANGAIHIALYVSLEPPQNQQSPAKEIAELRQILDRITKEIDRAIAHHEFEKARSLSDEAQKHRATLSQMHAQFGIAEPPPPIPILRIEILADDRLTEIQIRCDSHLAQGVPEVWLLNPTLKRAYTVNNAEGLRACKGNFLRLPGTALEMDLKEIFG